MTKIVHISDLHTGYAQFREDLLLQTIDEINKIQPSAVVISGDLTDQGFYRVYRSKGIYRLNTTENIDSSWKP